MIKYLITALVSLAVGFCLGSFYYGGGYLVVSYLAGKL
jgi:hypothetical protein